MRLMTSPATPSHTHTATHIRFDFAANNKKATKKKNEQRFQLIFSAFCNTVSHSLKCEEFWYYFF